MEFRLREAGISVVEECISPDLLVIAGRLDEEGATRVRNIACKGGRPHVELIAVCGTEAILTLANTGLLCGVVVAAPPNYWHLIERTGAAPVPRILHSDCRVITCHDTRYTHVFMRKLLEEVECITTGWCLSGFTRPCFNCGAKCLESKGRAD